MIAWSGPRYVLAAALLALTGALLAGCGGVVDPTPPAASAVAPAVTLPWPVGDADGVALLQKRVDGGAQPWLLEPTSVATAFATAAYGWPDARAAVVEGADTTVELNGPDGGSARILLAQPGRAGRSGIWVVTTASGP